MEIIFIYETIEKLWKNDEFADDRSEVSSICVGDESWNQINVLEVQRADVSCNHWPNINASEKKRVKTHC